ncbi:MAG: UDP-N-acetylmuramoyl-L-alanyl-D-glutamate--2,6-diaminopimelate ligase [Candidatus Omnitrophota bacterium]
MSNLSEILDNIKISDITCDSKKVKPEGMFIAVKGTKLDGYEFIGEAIQRGASCIVAERDFHCPKHITKIIVKDSKEALVEIAKSFYADPSSNLKVIGITGTNGKTTTAYLIEKMLTSAGYGTGVIGTISYRFGNRAIPATNTTPGVLDLQFMLHEMVQERLQYVVLEVSSHSLDQDRVAGINFECAVFTNLTHEHLDYHKDLEDYFLAKSKLFGMLAGDKFAVVNKDDPFGVRLINSRKGKILSYGLDAGADISCRILELNKNGLKFILNSCGRTAEVNSKLIGRHNIYNILAAAGAAAACNVDFTKVIKGIESAEPPPGRLQRVETGKPFEIFVDYAHSDDALKNVITALRELNPERIIVLFGCGGDRDKLKRPKMGKITTELADYVILTSDNPRTEDPGAIIQDIEKGITKSNYIKITDRRDAIFKLLGLAKPGDMLLLAGKGHETYQIFKDTTVSFYDVQVVKEALEKTDFTA